MSRSPASGALGLLMLALPALAADEPPKPPSKPPSKPSALDQQLLDGLDRELLQGLPGGIKPANPADKPALDKAGAIQSENPLALIAERMRKVEARLAQQDTSQETQDAQKQILAELAKLLEQARQQQAQKKPGGSGKGSNQAGAGSGNPVPAPPRDSTNRIEQGTKETVETADVKDLLRRIWGHLPDKLRGEMQASLSEQFLPKYERLIEEYYKRLAEERPGAP
ncbi:MAG TPA: hypothetical protein VFB80_24280 [Pirellulaceae bacterium]|nr:hypothetical protein [Pirellulaceae bacterium]